MSEQGKIMLRAATFAFAAIIAPTVALAGSCICLACLFDSKLENFQAVGESMSPTINTGECALMRHVEPLSETIAYGDVIGFSEQESQSVHVFRVVAKGGDTLSISDGQLRLNGHFLPRLSQGTDGILFPEGPPFPECEAPVQSGEACMRSKFRETSLNGISYEVLDVGITQGDDLPELSVPPGHLFVMGDHRDNARDSRVIGFVPLVSVLGIFDGL